MESQDRFALLFLEYPAPMVNQTLPQVKFNRNQSALRAVNMI